MRTLLLIATFASFGGPTLASAQCAEGRVTTEQTAGRCCWPGQSWNDTAARCQGPPQCPAGWAAEGDSCVQQGTAEPGLAPPTAPPGTPTPQAAAPGQYPPVQAYAPRGYGSHGQTYAPRPGWGPPPQPSMHEEEQPIRGLIITGTIMLGVGYVYSVIMGSLLLGATSCGIRNSWSMFIPVVGGYVWGAVDSEGCGSDSFGGDAAGIPGAGVQTIGLALLIIGVLVKRTVTVPRAAVSLVPRLASGPGEAGLALGWDF